MPYNDSNVMDNFEMTAIDCEGDSREVQIVIEFDISDGCYTVEKFIDSESQENESFDNREDADRTFDRWVSDIQKYYAAEKSAYDKGRVELAASSLDDVLSENAGDLDPVSAQAIETLADLIRDGHAGRALVGLGSIRV